MTTFPHRRSRFQASPPALCRHEDSRTEPPPGGGSPAPTTAFGVDPRAGAPPEAAPAINKGRLNRLVRPSWIEQPASIWPF
jgi:hypothetical protein